MTVYSVIVTIIAIALATNLLLTSRYAFNLNRLLKNRQAVCDAWEVEFKRVQGISHNFLNSCRLIAIHRNGRVNHFTFARRDQTFTIETMGLLSDDIRSWRAEAGLDQ